MTPNRFLLTLTAALLGVSATAWADQIYVAPASGSGVTADDLATATELVQSSVPEVGKHSIVHQASQADFVLQPRLVRLGWAYLMTLSKVRNGETVFSTQLKAERMDELDKVAKRLARAVLDDKNAKANPRVGEITDQEAKDGAQRRPVHKAFYVGMGGASLRNLNTTGLGYSLSTAYTFDLNAVRLKLFGEGDVNGNAFFVNGGIGGNYYFGVEDVAPYLAVDFGGGAAKIDRGLLDGETVGGFILGVGTGIEFFRTSSANLDLGFRAAFMLKDNPMGRPQAFTLRLGIYF
jgi:hypothetical protein